VEARRDLNFPRRISPLNGEGLNARDYPGKTRRTIMVAKLKKKSAKKNTKAKTAKKKTAKKARK
jgi:hypothetical protein